MNTLSLQKILVLFFIDCLIGLFLISLFWGGHYSNSTDILFLSFAFILPCSSLFVIAKFWTCISNKIIQALICVLWAMAVVFCSQFLIVIFLNILSGHLIDSLKAAFFIGLGGILVSFFLWIPIGLLNFICINSIFNKTLEHI